MEVELIQQEGSWPERWVQVQVQVQVQVFAEGLRANSSSCVEEHSLKIVSEALLHQQLEVRHSFLHQQLEVRHSFLHQQLEVRHSFLHHSLSR